MSVHVISRGDRDLDKEVSEDQRREVVKDARADPWERAKIK